MHLLALKAHWYVPPAVALRNSATVHIVYIGAPKGEGCQAAAPTPPPPERNLKNADL
jgi:hypothetical protein